MAFVTPSQPNWHDEVLFLIVLKCMQTALAAVDAAHLEPSRFA
jgi:hypothetical protein